MLSYYKVDITREPSISSDLSKVKVLFNFTLCIRCEYRHKFERLQLFQDKGYRENWNASLNQRIRELFYVHTIQHELKWDRMGVQVH